MAAAYHTPKHINEIPVAELVGKPTIKAYQDSAAKTVREGKLVFNEESADGTRKLVYHRHVPAWEESSVVEAIVIVGFDVIRRLSSPDPAGIHCVLPRFAPRYGPFYGLGNAVQIWIGNSVNMKSAWRPLEMNYYKAWRAIFNRNISRPDIDDDCPVCSARTLHRWYRLRLAAPRVIQGYHFAGPGPMWEWCSTCFSYLTFPDGFVPSAWVEPYEVDSETIPYEPEIIERARTASSGTL